MDDESLEVDTWGEPTTQLAQCLTLEHEEW